MGVKAIIAPIKGSRQGHWSLITRATHVGSTRPHLALLGGLFAGRRPAHAERVCRSTDHEENHAERSRLAVRAA